MPPTIRPVRTTSLLTAALATCVLALGACSDDGGDAGADTDAAAYDTTTLMPAVREAVADDESVHVTLGTKESTDDVEVDVSWGRTRCWAR